MNKKEISNKTKQSIYLSLYVCLMKKDFKDITVDDIVFRAGVSRMSFYRHFSSIKDVFISYSDERFEEFYKNYMPIRGSSIYDFIYAILNYLNEYRSMISILLETGFEYILKDQFESYFAYIFHKLVQESSALNIEKKYGVAFISGGFYNVVIKWLKSLYPEAPEVLANSIVKIFKELGNSL